jgi:hypothetical protein
MKWLAWLALLLPAAFVRTEPRLLSTGSPTKDEDPSLLRAHDGSLYLAWFSDRGNNPDIYLARRGGAQDWSPPVRVTTDPGGDFNPSLFQDGQGAFHLAWFRWTAPYRGHIFYNSSPDGLAWDPGTEVQVTDVPDVDDWVPTLTQAADGTLLIYFVSALRGASPTSDIYVAARHPGASGWDPAVPAAGLNSPTEHDHLPFAARTGKTITLVWVRHDTSEPLPWRNRKSDLFSSTSADGLDWAPPSRITTEPGDVVNLFPALFRDWDGQWSLLWLSTRLGAPRTFELPLARLGDYPQAVVENAQLPPGYSHRIAPTSRRGLYLGVWVQGPEGAQDIYYRFFPK